MPEHGRARGGAASRLGGGAGMPGTEGIRLDPALVVLDLPAGTAAEAIEALGQRMVERGYVTAEYPPAVVAREAVFPTGLPTEPIGVAIPHADPEGVLVPSIAVGRTAAPVVFGEMGSEERTVAVRLVFLLALTSKQQVGALSALVTAFREPGYLEALVRASDSESMLASLARVTVETT